QRTEGVRSNDAVRRGFVFRVRPRVGHSTRDRRKQTMRMAIRCLVVLALIAAFGAIDVAPGLAQGNGNSDHGCVTGNPSQGSECNGGPNDNQGKPGGGAPRAGGSNDPPSEPCGRADGDGTLNNQGNVPGCTSQGNAVNK